MKDQITTHSPVQVPSNSQDEEVVLDFALRPKHLEEFVGQAELKNNLTILMRAAQGRGEPIEHVLFYGAPGLGKTTLAHIIAKEMGAALRTTSGPALERVGDLAAILTNLGNGDVLFIDEIHRLGKTVEEMLYCAMEEYALDLIVGKGPAARTLRLDLPRFTLVGATTRISLLSSPLRDRFGATYHLTVYQAGDIEEVLRRNARLLQVLLEEGARGLIAQRSRGTPRVANRLLRRVRDFAQVQKEPVRPEASLGGPAVPLQLTYALAEQALASLHVDPYGLDEVDRRLLLTIMEKFKGGPVGLNTLAAASGEEEATIEEVYEPYLLQVGFLERTPRGRLVTAKAYAHLGAALKQGSMNL